MREFPQFFSQLYKTRKNLKNNDPPLLIFVQLLKKSLFWKVGILFGFFFNRQIILI
ncbi:hypothetical protein LEP1GSC051_1138 [Leptospira sp. P2653]|nr:hypothetical protein LEP1GSC051_1138 [Leptospira sp. P2653]